MIGFGSRAVVRVTRITLFAIIALLIGVACQGSTEEVASNTEFTMAPGGTHSVMDNSGQPTLINVQFVEVARDSRCPARAECVVPGEAELVFAMSFNDDEPQMFSLIIEPGGKIAGALEGYRLVVHELEPDPPTENMPDSRYRVRLTVEQYPTG